MKNLNPWRTLTIETVYENRWIHVTHRNVINPAGNPGIYGVVHFKNIAIGVVPLDEEMNTYLVGQFRYCLDEYSWEIPEGGCATGEIPLEAAKRELLEETGIIAKKWLEILPLHTSNSVTDEKGLVFIARDLTFGEASPEETEELQVKKIPFSEALQMVLTGRITDALSQIALMRVYFFLKEEGKI